MQTDEMKLRAQAIAWSDNSAEEKEAMILDLISQQREQVQLAERESVARWFEKGLAGEWDGETIARLIRSLK